jgi:hypothetical protein
MSQAHEADSEDTSISEKTMKKISAMEQFTTTPAFHML